MRRVGQVFDVKAVLPVEDSKAGPEADPFAVPFDVSENVSQSCYGSDKQTIVPENVSQDKQTVENVSQTKRLLLNAGDKILGAGGSVAHLLEVGHPSQCKKG